MIGSFNGQKYRGWVLCRRGYCLLTVCFFLLVTACASSGGGFEDGLAHLKLAWAHAERDEWEPAAREAAAAASLLRQKEKTPLLEALEILGASEILLGRPAQAASHFLEGISICGSCEERNRLRIGLAGAYRDLGRYVEAESLLKEILKDAEAAGSAADQALSFDGLAGVAIVQNRRAEAIPLVREALLRQDAAAKPVDRAQRLETLGVLQRETGDGSGALESLREAESLRAGLGDPSRLLRVRTNIAKAYVTLGRYDTAFALFEEVEAAARKIGDQNEISRSLTGSADILQMQGRTEEARKRLEQALEIERARGNHSSEASILGRLAKLDLIGGRYDLAYSRFEQAIALEREAGDRQGELISLIDSAYIYQSLNRNEEASARLRRAGELTANGSSQSPMAEAMFSILRHFEANRPDEALRQADQALTLARQMGTQPVEEIILLLRAVILVDLNRVEEGLQAAEAALVLSRQLGDRERAARLSFLIGYILLRQQRYDEARGSLEESLRFEREVGSSGPRAATLWALGAAYEKQWNSTAAIAAYSEAVEVFESAFAEIRADDLLTGLTENAIGSYGRLARLLVQKGDAGRAFAVAERARARTFLRRMGNPPPDLRKAVSPVLLREEESLREKIQVLTRHLRQEQDKTFAEQDRSELARIAREIDSARREYGTLLIRLQQASPEYTSLVHPSPLTVPEVQKLLDGDTALVEYLLLEDESLAWVIDRDSVHVVRLTMVGEEVVEGVEELRQRIAARQPVKMQAHFLYMGLFYQLVPYIHHRNVIVVPHGALHALPFAALTPDVGKTYLVERYALSILPSASVLPFVLAKRDREGDGMLALGDPDGSLPAAAAEARAVAALYGSRALVGREASAAALRAAPRPIDHLHIAAHAAFDPARPLFSRIRLADGDLAVHDIFGLDLRATNLVVLSGCETGVGQSTEVGELEGLSRAFLFAGAPAVVATLWAVDDLASRALMEAFYRRLRAGIPTAEALRQAQLEILLSKEWRHPFFWGGFTLTGDPGQ